MYVGSLMPGGSAAVWQAKFFVQDTLGSDQRRQIRKSFDRVVSFASEREFRLSQWTIAFPQVADEDLLTWLDTKREQWSEEGLEIALPWDDTRLRALLEDPECPVLEDRFFAFPRTTVRTVASDATFVSDQEWLAGAAEETRLGRPIGDGMSGPVLRALSRTALGLEANLLAPNDDMTAFAENAASVLRSPSVQESPHAPLLKTAFGQILGRIGRNAESLKVLQEVVDSAPPVPIEAFIEIALQLWNQGDLETGRRLAWICWKWLREPPQPGLIAIPDDQAEVERLSHNAFSAALFQSEPHQKLAVANSGFVADRSDLSAFTLLHQQARAKIEHGFETGNLELLKSGAKEMTHLASLRQESINPHTALWAWRANAALGINEPAIAELAQSLSLEHSGGATAHMLVTEGDSFAMQSDSSAAIDRWLEARDIWSAWFSPRQLAEVDARLLGFGYGPGSIRAELEWLVEEYGVSSQPLARTPFSGSSTEISATSVAAASSSRFFVPPSWWQEAFEETEPETNVSN